MIDSHGENRPIVVLLVDDQAFTGSVLGLLLESETDIALHCCLSAADAIGVANDLDPTVVLQDLVMPVIDGLTLVRAFGANARTAGTPVIVLSGNDDVATRTRALAAGACGYVVKLPSKAVLIACIRDHAARSAVGRDTLDLAVIDRFHAAGAPDFTRRLIDQFLLEAGTRVSALQIAAAGADIAALRTSAHSLKGSAMMMGAARLGALCGRVEHQVEATAVVQTVLIDEIGHELLRVQQALTAQKERAVPA